MRREKSGVIYGVLFNMGFGSISHEVLPFSAAIFRLLRLQREKHTRNLIESKRLVESRRVESSRQNPCRLWCPYRLLEQEITIITDNLSILAVNAFAVNVFAVNSVS